MSAPVFVTGATGLVGRSVVDALHSRGTPVRAGSRSPFGAQAARAGVDWVALDVGSPRALASALAGSPAVFVCPPSVREDEKLAVARALLDAAADAGAEHIAVLSGFSGARDPASVSRRIEEHAERSGPRCSLLRPNFFMQNYATVYAASIRRGAIDFFTGAGRTSLVDTRDLGAAAASVLCADGRGNRAYTLTGPEALDHETIAAILTRTIGREVAYTARSHEDTRRALREAGLPDSAIEGSVARFAEVEAGAFEIVTDDLGDLIGRAPIRFERFAADSADAWRG